MTRDIQKIQPPYNEKCDGKVSGFTAQFRRDPKDNRCRFTAKYMVDGKKLCARHAQEYVFNKAMQ